MQGVWLPREGGDIRGHEDPEVACGSEPLPDYTHFCHDLFGGVLEPGEKGGEEGELSQHAGGVGAGVMEVQLVPHQRFGNMGAFALEPI